MKAMNITLQHATNESSPAAMSGFRQLLLFPFSWERSGSVQLISWQLLSKKRFPAFSSFTFGLFLLQTGSGRIHTHENTPWWRTGRVKGDCWFSRRRAVWVYCVTRGAQRLPETTLKSHTDLIYEVQSLRLNATWENRKSTAWCLLCAWGPLLCSCFSFKLT